MRLTVLLRLNAALWLILGWLLLLKTPLVNLLLGTEKTMLMHSIGIILVFNGMIILMASLRQQIKPHEIMFVVIGDYGWTLLTLVLISAGAVIIDPTGIRVTFVVALVSAAMGALQFRHYKLLMGRH
jgi:hypothetical protein|tara:strand:- start:33 stop:413 length:381 start_codon:yes stop_codon:yes gene_type:complete